VGLVFSTIPLRVLVNLLMRAWKAGRDKDRAVVAGSRRRQ
jgi:hypothetical protein